MGIQISTYSLEFTNGEITGARVTFSGQNGTNYLNGNLVLSTEEHAKCGGTDLDKIKDLVKAKVIEEITAEIVLNNLEAE